MGVPEGVPVTLPVPMLPNAPRAVAVASTVALAVLLAACAPSEMVGLAVMLPPPPLPAAAEKVAMLAVADTVLVLVAPMPWGVWEGRGVPLVLAVMPMPCMSLPGVGVPVVVARSAVGEGL